MHRSPSLPEHERTPLALYGPLFIDVQMQQVFADGKTFVDARPKRLAPAQIRALYEAQRSAAGFSLADFVHAHFEIPQQAEAPVADGRAARPLRTHVKALWPQLTRGASESGPPGDTLLALPHPYVVPGGRFREVYYWDSYFTMLGLVEDGETALAAGMLDDFASMIDRYGHIPNGSRTYFLSRSQPPFFFKMIEAVSPVPAPAAHARYLPQLLAEHAYWMDGEDGLAPGAAAGHLVRLADGTLLNRFWDARDDPREESYRDDVLTARKAPERPPAEVFRDLRAGAESGWDFSGRWCADPHRLETIETTAILPVDLNALMWGLERAIAEGAAHAGDAATAAAFEARAERRREAIGRWHFSASLGHHVDHHWVAQRALPALTAAAFVPLYLGCADEAQAAATAAAAERTLLRKNGLVTTTHDTGQQWDSPNGWAPLQWMAVEGLRRYGHDALAGAIARRWIAAVRRVYDETGKLLEKYDVTEDRAGGGGEYPTQDGFGWTNGTLLALMRLYPDA